MGDRDSILLPPLLQVPSSSIRFASVSGRMRVIAPHMAHEFPLLHWQCYLIFSFLSLPAAEFNKVRLQSKLFLLLRPSHSLPDLSMTAGYAFQLFQSGKYNSAQNFDVIRSRILISKRLDNIFSRYTCAARSDGDRRTCTSLKSRVLPGTTRLCLFYFCAISFIFHYACRSQAEQRACIFFQGLPLPS